MTLNGPHHSSNLFTLYKISSLIFHIYKKWLFDLIKTLFTFYRSSPLYMFFKYNLSMHQLSKAHTICQRASPKLSLRSQEKKLLDKTKNEFKNKQEKLIGKGVKLKKLQERKKNNKEVSDPNFVWGLSFIDVLILASRTMLFATLFGL